VILVVKYTLSDEHVGLQKISQAGLGKRVVLPTLGEAFCLGLPEDGRSKWLRMMVAMSV